MRDSNDQMQDAVAGISQVIDATFFRARTNFLGNSGEASASRDFGKTQVNSRTVKLGGNNEEVRMEIAGPNAPIIARPISDLARPHVPLTRRTGSTAFDRTVKLTGRSEEIAGAMRAMQEFSEALKTPEVQAYLESLVTFALQLEHTVPSKVFLDLGVEGDELKGSVKKVLLTMDSPLLHGLNGRNGIRMVNHGPWKESDMKTEHARGVEIVIESPEGQEALENALHALPAGPALALLRSGNTEAGAPEAPAR